jgi:hypothetical protein
MPEKVEKSISIMKAGINEIIQTGQNFRKDSKKLLKEGREMPGEVGGLLKEADKQVKKEVKK